MDIGIDISRVINRGISDESEYQRAMIAYRKLRNLSRNNPEYKRLRRNLADLLEKYESDNWPKGEPVSDEQLKVSDEQENLAQQEQEFYQKRKDLIRQRLSEYGINQQQLGKILGHPSKSYMSELMNGLTPFTLSDLILISKVLKIDLDQLIPPFVSYEKRMRARSEIQNMKGSKLTTEDL